MGGTPACSQGRSVTKRERHAPTRDTDTDEVGTRCVTNCDCESKGEVKREEQMKDKIKGSRENEERSR